MDWINVPESIVGYVGFTYLIHNTVNNRLYIGKKLFFKTIRKKPLKGSKRARKFIVETDWKDYYGSSNELNDDIIKYGKDKFTRTILECYKTRWEWSYGELKAQVLRDVLRKKEYYNGIIRVRLPGYKKQ